MAFDKLASTRSKGFTEWQSSRHCLLEVLEASFHRNKDRYLVEHRLEDQEVQNHFSLSHSPQASIAIGARDPSKKILGIGVDLEKMCREISERAARRFISSSETEFLLKPLEIWVVKEACFKAVPNTFQAGLTSIQILNFDRAQCLGHAVGLTQRFEAVCDLATQVLPFDLSFKLEAFDQFFIAFACCRIKENQNASLV